MDNAPKLSLIPVFVPASAILGYANGQKQSFSMPDGTTYSYTYTDNNALQNIRIPGIGNISYPSYTLSRPDSVSFPGGSQSYTYDTLMRLKDINAQSLDYAYSYDNVSNILTKATEHGTYGYEYGDLYRLTDVDNPTLDDEAYTYDLVGNRLTASGVSGTITHNANNELDVYGDISYDYDANGNMVSTSSATETRQYIYNVQNRLMWVGDGSGTVIAEYGYDPFGRRLWKEVDGVRTYFFYSDEGPVAEYDKDGNEIRSYGYRPDSTWTTDPLWLKDGGEYYWYQNDHLGAPQQLIDSAGNIVWEAQYFAFGEAQIQVETVTNHLRFPGQYYDAETEWHYNWFRYYSPIVGRYTSVNPIGFLGGDVNLYGYVWNNSIILVDPKGLETVLIFTTERNPNRGEVRPWDHVAAYAEKKYTDEFKGKYESLDVKILDVNRVSQVNIALIEHENIVKIIIIGHPKDSAIHVGNDPLPDTNISSNGTEKDVYPSDLYWGNLTDDASIEIWGCRAGEGEYPVAKDVADASKVPVAAPDTYINFDKNGKPFFRWYRNGQWNTFTPTEKPTLSPTPN